MKLDPTKENTSKKEAKINRNYEELSSKLNKIYFLRFVYRFIKNLHVSKITKNESMKKE